LFGNFGNDNLKSKIQNPKSKIQNPKSKIQNPKSKIQNPKSKIQNPKSPMSSFPSLTVIIPIYNGESDLPDLLAALRAQTYPRDRVEYLIVDNGSGDRTYPLLQAAVSEDWNFRPLQENQIQSSYAARNVGIRAAQGDILAFTDADCRPAADWLMQLVQPFSDTTVGLVAGEILALPGDTLLERYADRHETLSQKHTMAHHFLPYGQTANLAVRRSLFDQVGLFRPYLTTGGDADICWRIQQETDWQIRLAADAIIRHRHRETLAELKSQWRRYGRSNRFLHELHGISLTRELKPKDYVHRWGRWALKEVPKAMVTSMVAGKGVRSLVDTIVDTPLNLICTAARSQGQRVAKLSDQARECDRL
jgi:cellulose synthase/poly-beta-1,6-N-acetylglucosamine synthase-like glycosyltransferase